MVGPTIACKKINALEQSSRIWKVAYLYPTVGTTPTMIVINSATPYTGVSGRKQTKKGKCLEGKPHKLLNN